jgi:hypothetical protein
VLEFIDAEYGSIAAYCEQIGFGQAQQEKLRSTLLE